MEETRIRKRKFSNIKMTEFVFLYYHGDGDRWRFLDARGGDDEEIGPTYGTEDELIAEIEATASARGFAMPNPLTPEKTTEIIEKVTREYRPTDSLSSCLRCRKLCKSFQSMPYQGAPFFIQSIHDNEIGEIDRAMRDAIGEGVDSQGIVSADDYNGFHYACSGPRPEIRMFMK